MGEEAVTRGGRRRGRGRERERGRGVHKGVACREPHTQIVLEMVLK